MLFNQLGTYYYVRPSTKAGKKGVFYLRVTANGRILATSSIKNIRCHHSDFNVTEQKFNPNSDVALSGTMFMQTANERLNLMHMEHEKKGTVITKASIANALPGIYAKSAGTEKEDLTFSGMLTLYIEDQRKQIGKTISQGTFDVRKRYKKVFEELLIELDLSAQPLINYTEDDIKEIQLEFMSSYANGTVQRAMFVLSAVMEFAIKKGLLDKNPCKGVKKVKADENPDLVWLEQEELGDLTQLELGGEQQQALDAFIFCCWTGLCMGDYLLLDSQTAPEQIKKAKSTKNIVPGKIAKTKEGLLLSGNRRKSGTLYRVHLMPEAQRILDKYDGIDSLPYSLRRTGETLNMAMKLIGVDKKIRFHTARKTLANYLINVLMMSPIYVIKIMGWSRIEEANPYVSIKDSSLYRALSRKEE